MKTVVETAVSDISKTWDCIVVGAGPAGAIVALQLSKRGCEVLLVDKSSFPRHKVCGCCLNNAAQNSLVEAGLGDLLKSAQAVPLHELQLFDGAKSASVVLPTSFSLSRERLDVDLINAAIAHGSQFLQNTTVSLVESAEEFQTVQLTRSESERNYFAKAKVLIVADGLSGRTLEGREEFSTTIDGKSRFGAGVIIDEPSPFYENGKIYMACASGGYVGLVRLEDGRLDVAAAFDPAYSRSSNGLPEATAEVLIGCGLPVPLKLMSARFSGTQVLTRRRERVAGHRLFIAGDACSYPEPFTGEGIAWALQSGLKTADLASKGIREWEPSLIAAWHDSYRRLKKQQLRSALVARTLRNDITRRLLINTAAAFPALASRAVHYITSVRSTAWQG